MEYLSLGCFKDNSEASALLSLETENATFLDGPYQSRKNAVMKCALEAAKNDFKVFAIQNGGECFSGYDAHSSYSMYASTDCPDDDDADDSGDDDDDDDDDDGSGYYVNEVFLIGGNSIFLLK